MEAIGEKGLLECIERGQLGRYGQIIRDPHGHLRLGEIEFGRMIKDRLSPQLDEIGLQITLIDKDLGYDCGARPDPLRRRDTRAIWARHELA